MKEGDIERIIRQGEGTRVEFKLRLPRPWRLAREIAAFANTLGGIIVIGVDDVSHIVGVDSVVETKQELIYAAGLVEPQVKIHTEVVRINKLELVICKVARGEDKPYRITENTPGGLKTKVYVRTGAAVEPVEEGEARKLGDQDRLRKRLRLTEDQKVLINVLRTSVRTSGGIGLKQLAHRLNMSTRRVTRLLVPLINAGIVAELKVAKGSAYLLRGERPY